MSIFYPGRIVACTFLDHAEDYRKPFLFTAYGKLVKIRDDSYVIESWTCTRDKDRKRGAEDNIKVFTVVRGAVVDLVPLVPE